MTKPTPTPVSFPEHVKGKIITVKLTDLPRYYQVNGLAALPMGKHDEPVIVGRITNTTVQEHS